MHVYCDGSIQGGNPGGWAVGGWVAKQHGDMPFARGAVDLGRKPGNTNNQAEYAAVEGALKSLSQTTSATDGAVVVFSDSQLVVNQLARKWQCGNPTLREYRQRIWELEKNFLSVRYQWIPREENSEADAQSRTLYPKEPG